MSIKTKLISNASYIFLDWVVSSILSFVFWLIIWKTLDPIDWGIISTATNFVILLASFVTLGIPSAVFRIIPHFINRKKSEYAYSLIKLSLKIVSVSIFIFAIALFFLSGSVSAFLKIPKDAFILTITSIAFISFSSFLGSVLYGFQEMKKFFVTDSLNFIIKTAGTAIFVVIGARYIGVLASFSLGYLITALSRFRFRYIKANSSHAAYGELFKYAFPALITGFSWSIVLYSQNIILTVLGSLSITGIFAIAFTLSNLLIIFSQVLTTAAFPIISGLSINLKTKNKQAQIISLIFRYTMFLTLPFAIVLLVFPEYAILLLSKQVSLPGAAYIPILVPASILYSLGYILHTNLYAIGKPHLQRNIVIITTSIFLVLSILLTKIFSATGLSFAYLVSMIFLFAASFVYLRRSLKFIPLDSFKILIASAAIILSFLILKSFIHSLIPLIISLVPVGFLYLVLLALLKFYREEDVRILEIIGKKVPFLGQYILAISKILSRIVKK